MIPPLVRKLVIIEQDGRVCQWLVTLTVPILDTGDGVAAEIEEIEERQGQVCASMGSTNTLDEKRHYATNYDWEIAS
jgi:hypothetical protein